MPSYVPCVKNGASGFVFYLSLISQADNNIFQANPTIAAGDAKIAIDDAAPANLATLPAVDADFTKRVKVVLSQAETNGDNLTIILTDAAGSEWCDVNVNIQTVAQTMDELDVNVDSILADTGTDGVVIPQAQADKVWGTAARALTDKVGFALSTAAILAIWHQLTANIVTADTIGKLLKDNVNATLSSRSSHAAADVWTAAGRELSTPNSYKADVSALALASVCSEARLAELAAANLPADVDAIKAKTDLQPAGVQKNVALSNVLFLMVLSSDHITPATGKTVTAQISKDGAAFVACTNAVAEVGSGLYKIDLTQAEMNYDFIGLKFTETDCDQTTWTFPTST